MAPVPKSLSTSISPLVTEVVLVHVFLFFSSGAGQLAVRAQFAISGAACFLCICGAYTAAAELNKCQKHFSPGEVAACAP